MEISILGCGWLGLPLAEQLIKKGYSIKGATTTPSKLGILKEKGIEGFQLKVTETAIVGEDIATFFKSDILILNIPPGRRYPDVATRHPLQIQQIITQLQDSSIRHLIFVSSTSVYGDKGGVVTEASPMQPQTKSANALVTVENLLQLQTTFDTTIVRMGGLVGNNRKPGRFLAGKKQVKKGNAPVNIVHQTDCIGVITEIISQNQWGKIYNVCADKHPKKADFYTYQAKKEGLEIPTFAKDTKEDYKVVSNELVKQELGYIFKYADPMLF